MTKSGPIAADRLNREDFKAFAAELRDAQDANKDRLAGVMARAEAAGVDSGGLRRFVARKRQDEEKRAQRDAIDQQCLYLAGERDKPAELPIGCELMQALNLFRRKMTVRQVAEEMKVSTGKAGKLLQLSRMFDVHVHGRVDKRQKVDVITPPEVAALPAHDPQTGEISETAEWTPPGEGEGTAEILPGPGGSLATNPPGNPALEGERDGRDDASSGLRARASAEDRRDDRLGGEGGAERPEGPPRGLERQGHVAGAAEPGWRLQDDAALRLHADGGRDRRTGAVALQPDRLAGNGLGDRDDLAEQSEPRSLPLGAPDLAPVEPDVPEGDKGRGGERGTPPPEARAVLPGASAQVTAGSHHVGRDHEMIDATPASAHAEPDWDAIERDHPAFLRSNPKSEAGRAG